MNNEKIEKGGQAEPPLGVPKTYEQFAELLQKKLNVVRELHSCLPSEKKALRELKEYYEYLLAACQYYKEFIQQYAKTSKVIG